MEHDEFEDTALLWWQRWQFPAALAALCVVLVICVWVQHSRAVKHELQITSLQERIKSGPLLPPGNVRSIKVIPDRDGSSATPQLTLRMTQPPELVELRIDVSFARLNTFRLTIDRKDQARVGTVRNVLRDSNGELHLAINTSALYPGTYQVAIEGLVNRGNPVKVGWLTVKVTD